MPMENIIGFAPLAIFFAILYFMLIRPQQKHQKAREEMLGNLKKGDKVITLGGIYGTIKEVREDRLTLNIADNVDIKMNRQGVERLQE